MAMKIGKMDWIFLVLCLLLGFLGEEAFFRSEIGISYITFIVAFYLVFFWRFRGFPFSHQRFGYLILCCIWLLAASFFLYDNQVFYVLNSLIIPVLVLLHLVLITSAKKLQWNQWIFISYLFSRLLAAMRYIVSFIEVLSKGIKVGKDESKFLVWKKIFIGILLSLPVLFVVMNLLITADSQFSRIIGGFPQWFNQLDAAIIMRIIITLIYTFAFFGFMQVLFHKQIKAIKQHINIQTPQMDAVITITVLVLMNVVYLLFAVVQFKYLFSGTLKGEFTYAEYARKGFFELLFVSLINLSITIIVVNFVNRTTKVTKLLTQLLLTILILSSGVMLLSASMRLSIYEEAYGFSFIRVLSHSFMIFLAVIFVYTLIKIWIEKLSLFHFYFITALVYYSAINIIDLNQIVVKQNIARYEQTGKIDVHYLNNLSSTGVLGLIDLFEKDQHIPDLRRVLVERKNEMLRDEAPWQSYNLKKALVKEKLNGINL
ncbi:hypothetical protein BIV60_10820 [Bacillus sp. MUM 116]|uniref:DUF4153 domain-containing protein n=1 Tax=Bacillus sp. MUM 116 TaxID=1678002 RepID=UPI0008F58887|nr:DUF4173 domain-containing protein [Bacillus sp. MUM 116]OIK15015.1 hypothetical protein BIV60_10820 [Bacillus sp. MUM 116]